MSRDEGRILGCLAGLAVGDAMGRPTELLLNYRRIEKKYGRVTGLLGRNAGLVTDDTRLTLALADAIISRNRMVTADELIDEWKDDPEFYWRRFARSFNRREGYWVGEHIVACAGRLGIPGLFTGYLNPSSVFAGNEAAMIMAPVGIVFRRRPAEAARAAHALSIACIAGAARDAAAAWAAGISEALLSEGSTVRSVIGAVRGNATPSFRGYVDRAMKVAGRFDDVFEARPALYAGCLRPVFIDSREAVPVALAMFSIAGGDPMTATRGGANFGRDADTIAGMAGLLSGALRGIGSIDRHIYRRVCEVNRLDLEGYARRLARITA